MNVIRLATSSLNQTPLDWSGNLRRLRRCITEARKADAALLCLPELAITGYGCEDQFLAASTAEQAMTQLGALLPETAGMVVALGLPLRHHNAVYNTVALLVDGRLAGFARLAVLYGDGKSFTMVREVEGAGPANEIRVVQNWFAELERLAPTSGDGGRQ